VNFNKQNFWNKKILGWERKRYQTPELTSHMLYSSSVYNRMSLAQCLIGPVLKGKRVLEIGCGSGLLANSILEAGASQYHGIDFAHSAIEKANNSISRKGISFAQVSLQELSVANNFDIILSLGVTDWLNLDELNKLAKLSKGKLFLHSFSQRELTFTQLFHQAYVYFNYGFKTKGYRPRYFDKKWIAEIFSFDKKAYIYNHKKMRFGRFITNI